MKRTLFFVVAVLLLLPFVFSFNCDSVSDVGTCKEIQSSSLTQSEKDEAYAALLYDGGSIPNHDIIKSYNKNINFNSAPTNSQYHSSKYIVGAWAKLVAISPSVLDGNKLLVPPSVDVQTNYDYSVVTPVTKSTSYPDTIGGSCRINYQIDYQNAETWYHLDGDSLGKDSLLYLDHSGTLTSKTEFYTVLLERHYKWNLKWSWWKWKKVPVCEYSTYYYRYDFIKVEDSKDVVVVNKKPIVSVVAKDHYSQTIKGEFNVANYSYFSLNFPNAKLVKKGYTYNVKFEDPYFYIAQLEAKKIDITEVDNVNVDGKTFYVKENDKCTYTATNHFKEINGDCNLDKNVKEEKKLTIKERDLDFTVLLYIILLLGFIYLIYKIMKSQFRKFGFFIVLLLILVPTVLAGGGDDKCGLTNIGSCLSDVMYKTILSIINAPIAPLLVMIKKLVTADVDVSIFYGVWSMVRAVVSVFYVLLIVYAGFVFVTSSSNPIKRNHAKEVLRNTFMMVILIQGSYYLYNLLISLSVAMSSSIIDLIDVKFFLLTIDNIVNIQLQIVYTTPYVFMLLIAAIFLVIRYAFVCIGVVMFPIGLFCYFIPPLKSYGTFIIHLFGLMIFITFFDLLIILVSSALLQVPLFANIKIIVMIATFAIINYTLWLTMKFAMKNSNVSGVAKNAVSAGKYIAALL